jgi:H+-transporting ATPase
MLAGTASSTPPPKDEPRSNEAVPSLGLTSNEARSRLAKCGPNEIPDISARPWRMALIKFWAPVPSTLEGTIVLEAVLQAYVDIVKVSLFRRLAIT